MKYRISKINPTYGKEFCPFELTLTFETKEEHEHFHNKAMSHIAKHLEEIAYHKFFGDFFVIGTTKLYPFANNFSGTIEND